GSTDYFHLNRAAVKQNAQCDTMAPRLALRRKERPMSDQSATMELRTRAVGPWPMNTYALVCPHTRASVLIDPGADVEVLQEMLAGTTPVAILLTHTHPDHVGALEPMRRLLNLPLMAHAGPHFNGLALPTERTLADGDAVQVGRHTLRA